jgi:thiamine biosynthesis lipoprotein
MNFYLCFSIFLLTLSALANRATDPALARFEFSEPHMGTLYRIVLYAPDEATAQKASRAAFKRVADLDAIMSDYRPTSELMRLCEKAGGDPVPVSTDLFTVLSRAQEVSRLSDGAFDVTVGPVVRLWRQARKTRKLPDPEKLAKALQLVGYQNVRLDAEHRTVQLLKKGMLLDLGGIAKGYAADEVLKVLKQHGITRALVAAGGDVAVSGPPPGAEGWKVGIANLGDPESKPKRVLLLHDAAVSTSGDQEQHVEIDGKRYSHIVDPRTGLGLLGRRSVTVVAPNGITSDSLTKVVSILGPEKGFKIIESQKGVSSLVVQDLGKGPETFQSKGFPKEGTNHRDTESTERRQHREKDN